MTDFMLTHLTFWGPDAQPASVEFGKKLNLIHGASDTGKSFIAEAIDYVLGGSGLRNLPEAEPYTQILLGLQNEDGSQETLIRRRTGRSRISVHNGHYRSPPSGAPLRELQARHDINDDNNISTYLLERMELNGQKLRKNEKNAVVSLTLRHLAHLCIILEDKMLGRTSSFLSGQYVQATVEKSAVRFLLLDEDDSGLTPEVTDIQKNISKGKAEMLDQATAELQKQLTGSTDEAVIRAQLARVNSTLNEGTDQIDALSSARSALLEQRTNFAEELTKVDANISEVGDLLGRLTLLAAQYASDLKRLEMVREAGTFLGYFHAGPCVFCGASVEHQANNVHVDRESTELALAVDSERAKTSLLAADLSGTLNDLGRQLVMLSETRASLQASRNRCATQILELDQELNPAREAVSLVLEQRSNLERMLSIFEQVQTLNALRGTFTVGTTRKEKIRPIIPSSVLAEFVSGVRKVLTSWGLEEAANADFDAEGYDLIVNGQTASLRGKGMRGLLHSAASLALAEYRFRRSLPYLGFVVLDSPLVTYRSKDVTKEDELLEKPVTDAFLLYLESEFPGQSIVLENVDPPALSPESQVVEFTKNSAAGRYGFFPV